MSWARKLDEVRTALAADLPGFIKPRIPDVHMRSVVDDLMNNTIRVSMDRSATRLRRRLYASWLRPDLALGELVHLTPEGVRPRVEALTRDPDEVGDLTVDLFRLNATLRGLGKGKLSPADRVAAALLILNTAAACTRAARTPCFTQQEVALLLVLHAVEASRQVKKDAVAAAATRYFGQWGLAAPAADDLAKDLARLAAAGCIAASDDGSFWKLSDRVAFAW